MAGLSKEDSVPRSAGLLDLNSSSGSGLAPLCAAAEPTRAGVAAASHRIPFHATPAPPAAHSRRGVGYRGTPFPADPGSSDATAVRASAVPVPATPTSPATATSSRAAVTGPPLGATA
jgi:hypothetical protein